MQPEQLAAAVADVLKLALAPLLRDHAALSARLEALERRPPMPGPPGEPGAPGIDGKDGAPGPAGRDGTLEQLMAEYDGERTITLRHKDGAPIEGGVITFAMPLDREAYSPGRLYQKGDCVTYAGGYWIARMTTDARPDAGGPAWRLAVKKGAEGKPGRDGADLRDLPVVSRGRV